ncbi:MAG: monooxygenase [Egibacteraceae bacterium]
MTSTTVHIFTLRRGAVPFALARAAADPWRLRATPGVRFAKVLGTGDGSTFTLRDADIRRWALLIVWAGEPADTTPVIEGWRRITGEEWRADLALVHSRGRWAGREPFGEPAAGGYRGPVAAITRARLNPRHARAFWRAVPAVAQDLTQQPGLRFSIGIGEAPIGLQGTFSVWESAAALVAFAYRGAPHREVVRRTPEAGWYAEELFARFAVLRTAGTLQGANPLES